MNRPSVVAGLPQWMMTGIWCPHGLIFAIDAIIVRVESIGRFFQGFDRLEDLLGEGFELCFIDVEKV